MPIQETIEINVLEMIRENTIKVKFTKQKETSVRCWIAGKLFKLAELVLGTDVKIEAE